MKHSYFFDEDQLEKGAVKHSLETEINDALILGDMMKYFDYFPTNK
ncbi:MAG: hypothetical protein ACYDIA_08415 [Candidatus Humimicrobiaceae bacterium]